MSVHGCDELCGDGCVIQFGQSEDDKCKRNISQSTKYILSYDN